MHSNVNADDTTVFSSSNEWRPSLDPRESVRPPSKIQNLSEMFRQNGAPVAAVDHNETGTLEHTNRISIVKQQSEGKLDHDIVSHIETVLVPLPQVVAAISTISHYLFGKGLIFSVQGNWVLDDSINAALQKHYMKMCTLFLWSSSVSGLVLIRLRPRSRLIQVPEVLPISLFRVRWYIDRYGRNRYTVYDLQQQPQSDILVMEVFPPTLDGTPQSPLAKLLPFVRQHKFYMDSYNEATRRGIYPPLVMERMPDPAQHADRAAAASRSQLIESTATFPTRQLSEARYEKRGAETMRSALSGWEENKRKQSQYTSGLLDSRMEHEAATNQNTNEMPYVSGYDEQMCVYWQKMQPHMRLVAGPVSRSPTHLPFLMQQLSYEVCRVFGIPSDCMAGSEKAFVRDQAMQYDQLKHAINTYAYTMELRIQFVLQQIYGKDIIEQQAIQVQQDKDEAEQQRKIHQIHQKKQKDTKTVKHGASKTAPAANLDADTDDSDDLTDDLEAGTDNADGIDDETVDEFIAEDDSDSDDEEKCPLRFQFGWSKYAEAREAELSQIHLQRRNTGLSGTQPDVLDIRNLGDIETASEQSNDTVSSNGVSLSDPIQALDQLVEVFPQRLSKRQREYVSVIKSLRRKLARVSRKYVTESAKKVVHAVIARGHVLPTEAAHRPIAHINKIRRYLHLDSGSSSATLTDDRAVQHFADNPDLYNIHKSTVSRPPASKNDNNNDGNSINQNGDINNNITDPATAAAFLNGNHEADNDEVDIEDAQISDDDNNM